MLLAALALFAGVGLVSESPASAHVASDTAGFMCGSTRPGSNYFIQHAKPDHIQAEYVRYYCRATNGFESYQWWVYVWWNNVVTHTDYQDCSIITCNEP